MKNFVNLSVYHSPRIINGKKAAKKMKRTYVFSFYGKRNGNGFSLPGGDSSAYSLRDQLIISDKRSALPTTPIPKTVLSFRTTTGNKYDDGVSSFQQITDICTQPASIYRFKVDNRNNTKRCEIYPKFTIKTPEQSQ